LEYAENVCQGGDIKEVTSQGFLVSWLGIFLGVFWNVGDDQREDYVVFWFCRIISHFWVRVRRARS
jgi:hypothetical protein